MRVIYMFWICVVYKPYELSYTNIQLKFLFSENSFEEKLLILLVYINIFPLSMVMLCHS